MTPGRWLRRLALRLLAMAAVVAWGLLGGETDKLWGRLGGEGDGER